MLYTCIHSFIEQFPTTTKFVMKAPFVTNGKTFHYMSVNGEDDAVACMRAVHKKIFIEKSYHAIPYMMLQVRYYRSLYIVFVLISM